MKPMVVALAVLLAPLLLVSAASAEPLCDGHEQASWCQGPSEPHVVEDSCLIGMACDPRWGVGGEWWSSEGPDAPSSVDVRPEQTTIARELPATGSTASALARVALVLLVTGAAVVAASYLPIRGDEDTRYPL